MFWLLQLQMVLNFVFISVSGLKWEIKTKRQGIEKQCWSSVFWGDLCTFIQDYWPLCILSSLSQSLPTGCRGQFFGCHMQRFYMVQQSCIFNFLQPQLVLKFFLIFDQSEPHCFYKVVLIKKSVELWQCSYLLYFV